MAASRKSSDRERNSAKNSAKPSGGGRSRKAAGSKDPKRTGNPLTHIRFGSAGSGGAEFEPVGRSSKKRARWFSRGSLTSPAGRERSLAPRRA